MNARPIKTMNNREMSEPEKRWVSWSLLVNAGAKHSYGGTVTRAQNAKNRAKAKRAKASRKANRG